MDGLLKKTNKGWQVLYTKCVPRRMTMEWTSSIPLHPKDSVMVDKIFGTLNFTEKLSLNW